MLRADVNLYQTSMGEAVCFSAVADGSKNLASQGAYELKDIPLILSDFLKKPELKEIYLKSLISDNSCFKKLSESLLTQVKDSLKEKGIEAKIIIA